MNSDNNLNFHYQVGDKIVQLKEERTLLSWFLITACKHPELDLQEASGNYEFSVVPRSLFTQDGQPLHSSDKAKIIHKIKAIAVGSNPNFTAFESPTIIINGMALVDKVHKDSNVKTWEVITSLSFLFVKAIFHKFWLWNTKCSIL